MKKTTMFFLFIVVFSYAQDISDERVRKHHKDNKQPKTVELSSEERQRYEADLLYTRLLKFWDSGINDDCQQFRLNTQDTIRTTKNGIDSTTAISISIRVAEECYDSKITAIAARLMGDNKEHWMVYLNRYCQDCWDKNRNLAKDYLEGKLIAAIFNMKPMETSLEAIISRKIAGKRSPLGPIIGVLISKKDGQVLFMTGL